jgi:predicted phosphoribosyltransferase
VAPHDSDPRIDEAFDAVVVLARPRRFGSVGTWYRDFRQVEDEQVRVLLNG